jgi:hypothetical protein
MSAAQYQSKQELEAVAPEDGQHIVYIFAIDGRRVNNRAARRQQKYTKEIGSEHCNRMLQCSVILLNRWQAESLFAECNPY